MTHSATKHDLVQDLFIRTADENYITARWCFLNQLNLDFLWLAVHALEKYMKAVLLLNGADAKQYGHDITKLYDALTPIAGALLPSMLSKPVNLNTGFWKDMTPERFLGRLYRNGNADNRYLLYGYTALGSDLHMLDMMVFAIRRLSVVLDGPHAPAWNAGVPRPTNRELLTEQQDWFDTMYLPLDQAISAKDETPARQAALNLNLAFAPDGYPHGSAPGGIAARNPVILRRNLDPMKSDNPKWRQEGIELAEWILENVKLPGSKKNPGIIQEIEEAIAEAKKL